MSIEWNDKYNVGDTGIDGEHIELFRIANGFLNASGQEAQRKHNEAGALSACP